jgi:hypothetical protein
MDRCSLCTTRCPTLNTQQPHVRDFSPFPTSDRCTSSKISQLNRATNENLRYRLPSENYCFFDKNPLRNSKTSEVLPVIELSRLHQCVTSLEGPRVVTEVGRPWAVGERILRNQPMNKDIVRSYSSLKSHDGHAKTCECTPLLSRSNVTIGHGLQRTRP